MRRDYDYTDILLETSGEKLDSRAAVRRLLEIARLSFEKCELQESGKVFKAALKRAKEIKDSNLAAEALAGLLYCASEALDQSMVREWESKIDDLVRIDPDDVSPLIWYFKGSVAVRAKNYALAQRNYLRFIRKVRAMDWPRENIQLWTARGLLMLANCAHYRGNVVRAEKIVCIVLDKYEKLSLAAVNGLSYMLLGYLSELKSDWDGAFDWYKKAHAAFLAEHNWYYHLYVLHGYARISRKQKNFAQAYWYLDLIEKATPGDEFGVLKRAVRSEKSKLESEAVDILIDARKSLVKRKNGEEIAVGKRHVLLDLLAALAQAHNDRTGAKGLSKSDLIERVWGEKYRPEAHDNKLYYNINRLRKLIESDSKNPEVLLNWKEGYRFAPGLRVHFIGKDDEILIENRGEVL